MVATEAWKLLPQYVMIPETAEWRHHGNSVIYMLLISSRLTVQQRGLAMARMGKSF